MQFARSAVGLLRGIQREHKRASPVSQSISLAGFVSRHHDAVVISDEMIDRLGESCEGVWRLSVMTVGR